MTMKGSIEQFERNTQREYESLGSFHLLVIWLKNLCWNYLQALCLLLFLSLT